MRRLRHVISGQSFLVARRYLSSWSFSVYFYICKSFSLNKSFRLPFIKMFVLFSFANFVSLFLLNGLTAINFPLSLSYRLIFYVTSQAHQPYRIHLPLMSRTRHRQSMATKIRKRLVAVTPLLPHHTIITHEKGLSAHFRIDHVLPYYR